MALTALTVSGQERESAYDTHPDHHLNIRLCPGLVEIQWAGQVVACSEEALELHESGYQPVYYFPPHSVDQRWLEPSAHTTYCPFKGEASYWHLRTGDRQVDHAVWSYQDPLRQMAGIQNYLAFDRKKIDHVLVNGKVMD